MTSWDSCLVVADSRSLSICIAVAVPDPLATQIDSRRSPFQIMGRREMEPHITILPPRRVQRGEFEDLRAIFASVASVHSGFQVRLRGAGTFRPRSPVVYVRVEDADACKALALDLHLVIEDSLERYEPHVTVARRVPDDVLDEALQGFADFDSRFEVERVWLYVRSERVWMRQASLPLGPPPAS